MSAPFSIYGNLTLEGVFLRRAAEPHEILDYIDFALASGAEILHDVALMVGRENVAGMRFLEEMITVGQQNMYVHKVQLRSLISTYWKMSLPNSSSSKASWMSR